MKKHRQYRSNMHRVMICALLLAGMILALPVRAKAAFTVTEDTTEFKNLDSDYAVLINADTGEIIAEKNAHAQMYPASMTKIMTVLVAAEEIGRQGRNISDTVTITQDIIDYVVNNGGSAVGFELGEKPTVMDLLWGTALPSGADAALALARYVAGSEDAFVELMNEKTQELGLTDTHFTNPVGMYDDENYTTPVDMADILYAATKNSLAWAVLSTQQYTTSETRQHSDGITVTNRFLQRLSRQNVPGIVFSAKTGYIAKAGSCAASFFVSNDNIRYVCVTGKASNTWQCIYDQAAIYQVYCTPEEPEETEETGSESGEGEASDDTVEESKEPGTSTEEGTETQTPAGESKETEAATGENKEEETATGESKDPQSQEENVSSQQGEEETASSQGAEGEDAGDKTQDENGSVRQEKESREEALKKAAQESASAIKRSGAKDVVNWMED